jgi:hypothetical protein
VLRWFLVVLAAWMTLELSGLRAVFAGDCDAACIADCADGEEDPGCDPCACCPVARSEGRIALDKLPEPLERFIPETSVIALVLEPDPHEILHVPIAHA